MFYKSEILADIRKLKKKTSEEIIFYKDCHMSKTGTIKCKILRDVIKVHAILGTIWPSPSPDEKIMKMPVGEVEVNLPH